MAKELPSREEILAKIYEHWQEEVKRIKNDMKKSEAWVDKIRDIAAKVMPLLPETWEVSYYPWGQLSFSNFMGEVGEGKKVPKEEFRLAMKVVEQASGFEMKAGASFLGENLSHLYAYVYPTDDKGESLGWRIQIVFYRGDCKFEVKEKTVRTPRLVDPCLGIIE